MSADQLYIGTYRRAQHADQIDIAFGIYSFELSGSLASNPLAPASLIETLQPGWLAIHPAGHTLYAVNELRQMGGHQGGGVTAFRRDPVSGALHKLNEVAVPAMPCHCAVSPDGCFALFCTFAGGTVHSLAIEQDGKLGAEVCRHQHTGSSIHPRRQLSPHPHAVHFDPTGRWVIVPDLGTDELVVYEFEAASGQLLLRPERTVRLTPGSGPRHLGFQPRSKSVYLINEMLATIDTFRFDPDNGVLTHRDSVNLLPEEFSGFRSGGEIAVHPSGRFLYASTRSRGSSGPQPVPGLDSMVWFEIDQLSGRLDMRGRISSGGEIPRSFTFDSTGTRLYVGHQGSGNIVTFSLTPDDGSLAQIGEPRPTPAPVALLLVPGSTTPDDAEGSNSHEVL